MIFRAKYFPGLAAIGLVCTLVCSGASA
jgi:cyclase